MKKNKPAGFTLIELMISITLGALLIIGVFNILINSNTINRNTRAGNDIQEAGRFAMEFITRDIHMAGSTRIQLNPLTNGAVVNGDDISLEPPIEAIPFQVVNPDGTLRPRFEVRYPDGVTADIDSWTRNNPGATTSEPSSNRSKIHGDVLVVQYYPPNLRGCDGQVYQTRELVVNIYWARGSGLPTTGNDPEGSVDSNSLDALYCLSYTPARAPTTAAVQPLVLGVEAMEIQVYNNSEYHYIDPREALHGDDIDGVRIALLVRAKQTLNRDLAVATPKVQIFQLLSTQYTPNAGIASSTDANQSARIFRQVYESSAQLFNNIDARKH